MAAFRRIVRANSGDRLAAGALPWPLFCRLSRPIKHPNLNPFTDLGNTSGVPDCIFCKILSGEIPATFVLQEKDCAAFLDNRPLFPGHVLLMPRDHHETLPDLPPGLIQPLFAKAQQMAIAVEEALDAQGTFVAINNRISQSVPHLHIHVVPRRPKDGLRGFFWPRKDYGEGEAEAVAKKIRQALKQEEGGSA